MGGLHDQENLRYRLADGHPNPNDHAGSHKLDLISIQRFLQLQLNELPGVGFVVYFTETAPPAEL